MKIEKKIRDVDFACIFCINGKEVVGPDEMLGDLSLLFGFEGAQREMKTFLLNCGYTVEETECIICEAMRMLRHEGS